ncbi:MAG: MATE family efflux transporter [Clostridia bacterium]|nr:MATE family efflux transporter [Clostridia bacterium]
MDLLNGKVKPIYFKYLAAASGSAVIGAFFGMVDAMVVGKYHGPVGNAALAVFSPFWSIIFCLGFLTGIGGSVLFANYRGKGDEKTAQQYFTLSIIYGILLSAIAMLGIGIFQDKLFRFFGADDELLPLAKLYLKPILYAIPCCIFSNILSSYLRNDNNPTLATIGAIAGGIFNCVGDYVLVFVFDMGIFGAALATAVGQFVSILIMLTHFLRKKNTLHLVKPTNPFKKLGSISVAGFSTAIGDLALGIICIFFNRQIMTHLGANALAIYGVTTQVTSFAQGIAYGAGQAAQPIISQAYGAKRYDRIKKCLKYGAITSLCMGVFWVGLMLIFPNGVINFFMSPTPEVKEIAPSILRAYGLSYILLPFNVFTTYYFQSMMKPSLSVISSVARGIVVSGAMILLLPILFGASSLWYAMLLTEAIVAIYGVCFIIRCTKKLA